MDSGLETQAILSYCQRLPFTSCAPLLWVWLGWSAPPSSHPSPTLGTWIGTHAPASLVLRPLAPTGPSLQHTGKGNPPRERHRSLPRWQAPPLSFSRRPTGLAVNVGELPGERRAVESIFQVAVCDTGHWGAHQSPTWWSRRLAKNPTGHRRQPGCRSSRRVLLITHCSPAHLPAPIPRVSAEWKY